MWVWVLVRVWRRDVVTSDMCMLVCVCVCVSVCVTHPVAWSSLQTAHPEVSGVRWSSFDEQAPPPYT